jgi:hypothetical protein
MTDKVYAERNALAVGFVKAALAAGWPAGQGQDKNFEAKGWTEEWSHVLYVQLPNGAQVSWHVAPSELHLLRGIPKFRGKWDGTFLGRDTSWPNRIKAKDYK